MRFLGIEGHSTTIVLIVDRLDGQSYPMLNENRITEHTSDVVRAAMAWPVHLSLYWFMRVVWICLSTLFNNVKRKKVSLARFT